MADTSRNTNKIALLALNLFIAAICIAGCLLSILLYKTQRNTIFGNTTTPIYAFRPTRTWTPIPTVTLTPTLARTPRPVSTATVTLTPTQTDTPTQTPTITVLPSLTPAKPLVYSDAYKLLPWSPASADYMVQLMQGYPVTIGSSTSSTSSQAYFQAFELPIFALKESLLRFSDVSQADPWEWTLAFDLALAGSPQAGEKYADLIAGGLKRDQTDISQLYAWFQLKEP